MRKYETIRRLIFALKGTPLNIEYVILHDEPASTEATYHARSRWGDLIATINSTPYFVECIIIGDEAILVEDYRYASEQTETQETFRFRIMPMKSHG